MSYFITFCIICKSYWTRERWPRSGSLRFILIYIPNIRIDDKDTTQTDKTVLRRFQNGTRWAPEYSHDRWYNRFIPTILNRNIGKHIAYMLKTTKKTCIRRKFLVLSSILVSRHIDFYNSINCVILVN